MGVCKIRERNAIHFHAVLDAVGVSGCVCKTRERNAIHFHAVLLPSHAL